MTTEFANADDAKLSKALTDAQSQTLIVATSEFTKQVIIQREALNKILEDLKIIRDTVNKLDSFNNNTDGLSQNLEDLIETIQGLIENFMDEHSRIMMDTMNHVETTVITKVNEEMIHRAEKNFTEYVKNVERLEESIQETVKDSVNSLIFKIASVVTVISAVFAFLSFMFQKFYVDNHLAQLLEKLVK